MWSILAGLKQPEYTGTNRCIPCTVLNLGIAVVLAGTIGVLSPPIGGTVFVLSVGVIYFRGYLLPGTPEFTERYLPDSVLRRFDHHPTRRDGPPGGLDVETVLVDAGALEECNDGANLCMTEEFQRAWRLRIDEQRNDTTTRRELARLLEISDEDIDFTDHGQGLSATVDDHWIGQWESKAALMADLAAFQELEERYPKWRELSIDEQSRVLNGLRIFIDQCPVCDGPVYFTEDLVASCCRSIEVIAASCDDCGARLFEQTKPSGRM